MKLVDMEMKGYLNLLKSKVPAPGGGSASAVAGVQGVALFLMVGELTLGRERYIDYEETCREATDKCREIYGQLLTTIDEDTVAYQKLNDCFKLPKNTEEEIIYRKKAIGEATILATRVPYRMMELALEAIRAGSTMVGNSNPNAISDIGVAVLNLCSCIRGAWLNVKINLPGIGDEGMVNDFLKNGEEICREGESLTREVYEQVLARL